MKLDRYQLVSEDDEAFHLDDGQGQFKVAKRGLGKGMMDKIVQHFAKGGEVKEKDEIKNRAFSLSDFGTGEPPPSMPVAPPDIGPPMTPAQVAQATGGTLSPPSLLANTFSAAYGRSGAAPVPVEFRPPPAEPTPAQPTGIPPPEASPAPVSASPVAAPAPMPLPPMPGGGVAGADKEMKAAYAQAQDAAKAEGERAAREAQAAAEAQARNEANRQAVQAEWEKKHSDWQGRGEQLFKDISQSKIEPNRLWNSSNTGQKLSASIGMILGGLGAGISGGPNQAIAIIDKAISRDIDAQKSELGKKENLLSFHMQQGHDLRAAQQLAKADAMDAAAAQIQAASLKYAGEKAQVHAQSQVAALRGEAVKARQGIAGQGMDIQLKGMQVQVARGQIVQQHAITEAIRSGKLSPEALDPKAGERAVKMPDGSTRYAPTMEEGKQVRDGLAKADELRGLVAKMRAHRKEFGSEQMPGKAKATGEALTSQAKLVLKEAAKLGVLSETDVGFLDDQVPNVNGSRVFGTTDDSVYAKLDALEAQINQRVLAEINRKTQGPDLGSGVTPRKAGQ